MKLKFIFSFLIIVLLVSCSPDYSEVFEEGSLIEQKFFECEDNFEQYSQARESIDGINTFDFTLAKQKENEFFEWVDTCKEDLDLLVEFRGINKNAYLTKEGDSYERTQQLLERSLSEWGALAGSKTYELGLYDCLEKISIEYQNVEMAERGAQNTGRYSSVVVAIDELIGETDSCIVSVSALKNYRDRYSDELLDFESSFYIKQSALQEWIEWLRELRGELRDWRQLYQNLGSSDISFETSSDVVSEPAISPRINIFEVQETEEGWSLPYNVYDVVHDDEFNLHVYEYLYDDSGNNLWEQTSDVGVYSGVCSETQRCTYRPETESFMRFSILIRPDDYPTGFYLLRIEIFDYITGEQSIEEVTLTI